MKQIIPFLFFIFFSCQQDEGYDSMWLLGEWEILMDRGENLMPNFQKVGILKFEKISDWADATCGSLTYSLTDSSIFSSNELNKTMSYYHCGHSNNLTFVDGGPEIFNTVDPIGSKILDIFREKECACYTPNGSPDGYGPNLFGTVEKDGVEFPKLATVKNFVSGKDLNFNRFGYGSVSRDIGLWSCLDSTGIEPEYFIRLIKIK